MNKTKYIIPFKYNGDIRRLLNLEAVKNHFTSFKNTDICIVEQGITQIIKDSLFLYNDKKFNKSWSLNYAVKKAEQDNYKNIILGDADFICSKWQIDQSIEHLKEYESVSPFFQNVIYLNEKQSNEFILNKNIDNLKNIPDFKEKRAPCIPLAAGIICFTISGYKKIGGFPEVFEGWGGEDDVVSSKITKCLKYGALTNAKAFHLFHDDPTKTADPDRFSKCDQFRLLSKEELIQKAKDEWDTLGNPDLYKGDTK